MADLNSLAGTLNQAITTVELKKAASEKANADAAVAAQAYKDALETAKKLRSELDSILNSILPGSGSDQKPKIG